MMEPPPKRQNVEQACQEIAKVVHTLPESRFQAFGAGNFIVATIQDTERLKDSRANNDAKVIAAHQEHACDQRQHKNRYRPRIGMNWELEKNTRETARNRPIQKP